MTAPAQNGRLINARIPPPIVNNENDIDNQLDECSWLSRCRLIKWLLNMLLGTFRCWNDCAFTKTIMFTFWVWDTRGGFSFDKVCILKDDVRFTNGAKQMSLWDKPKVTSSVLKNTLCCSLLTPFTNKGESLQNNPRRRKKDIVFERMANLINIAHLCSFCHERCSWTKVF